MCFIGHGSFGIITKPIWCNYFAVFGIGQATAYQLMPFVGIVDILFGIIILIYPIRAIPAWLVIWGIITAFLRPLSGEPFAEVIERAGNFGAPFALLVLSGGVKPTIKSLLSPIDPDAEVDAKTIARLTVALRVIVCLLLAGHGWLNLIEKKSLMSQYTALGFANPANVAHIVGTFEIAAALLVLIKPIRPIVIAFLVWKAGSELFYPHYEMFEWIERGGSYGTILALWYALGAEKNRSSAPRERSVVR